MVAAEEDEDEESLQRMSGWLFLLLLFLLDLVWMAHLSSGGDMARAERDGVRYKKIWS